MGDEGYGAEEEEEAASDGEVVKFGEELRMMGVRRDIKEGEAALVRALRAAG